MKMMTMTACAVALMGVASAQCYTYGTVTSCFDAQSGNSYTTYNFGNQSQTIGSNYRTGSRWSQNTIRVTPDYSATFGQASNGAQWTQNSLNTGYGTSVFGQDSSGSSYGYYIPRY